MRFITFIKSINSHKDNEIKLFLEKVKLFKNFPLSSDPRMLAFFLFNKLNDKEILGFQKCMMLYYTEPKNQLAKDILDKQNFIVAINMITNLKNNPDLLP